MNRRRAFYGTLLWLVLLVIVALAAPPSQIQRWFNRSAAFDLAKIDLITAGDRNIAFKGVRGDADSLTVAARGEQVGAARTPINLPNLLPSSYRPGWRLAPNADASASVAEALPWSFEAGLGWLNLGALAGLVGALTFVLWALPWASRQHHVPIAALEYVAIVRRRLLMLAEWSGMAGLLAAVTLLLVQSLLAADGGPGRVLTSAWEIIIGTRYGLAWLAHQSALGLLVASTMFYRRQIARPVGWPITKAYSYLFIVLTLSTGVAQALESHAAAATMFVWVLADTAHLLAASAWSGEMLALVVVVVPLLRADRDAASLGWALLRGFGVLTAGSLAVWVISGLLLAGQQAASLDALLTMPYR